MGVRCFTQSDLSIRLRNAGASLAALLFFSAFLHLEVTAVPTISSGMIFRGQAGGLLGQVFADGLRAYFASTGAHILIIAGLLISLLFTTPLSLAQLAVKCLNGGERLEIIRTLLPERKKEETVAETPETPQAEKSQVDPCGH